MKLKILAISFMCLGLVACGSKSITSKFNGKIYTMKNQSLCSTDLLGFDDDKLYYLWGDNGSRIYTYTSIIEDYYMYKYEYGSYQDNAYLLFNDDYSQVEIRVADSQRRVFNLDKENIYSLNDLKKRL